MANRIDGHHATDARMQMRAEAGDDAFSLGAYSRGANIRGGDHLDGGEEAATGHIEIEVTEPSVVMPRAAPPSSATNEPARTREPDKVSPDPMYRTDRYRLVTPYSLDRDPSLRQ
jgi:hypothetical protein